MPYDFKVGDIVYALNWKYDTIHKGKVVSVTSSGDVVIADEDGSGGAWTKEHLFHTRLELAEFLVKVFSREGKFSREDKIKVGDVVWCVFIINNQTKIIIEKCFVTDIYGERVRIVCISNNESSFEEKKHLFKTPKEAAQFLLTLEKNNE